MNTIQTNHTPIDATPQWEARMRRALRRRGLTLTKSRARSPYGPDYMISFEGVCLTGGWVNAATVQSWADGQEASA